MSVWDRYDNEQREEYIRFIKMYASLSKLFNQKASQTGAPYLDSKFQENIYARSFNSKDVDIGNTPHDIKSVFDDENIGIGIKTWLNSVPSYQKVMQLKAYKDEIEQYRNKGTLEELAYKISEIKNTRMKSDYARLGLKEDRNIYHYITRDSGKMLIQETSYPLVDMNSLEPVQLNEKSFLFKDKYKSYKYTFGDSQIWMKFGEKKDRTVLDEENIDIMEDPYGFLSYAFDGLKDNKGILTLENETDSEENYTYLPLYSYKNKKVEPKSGLNSFNSSPKERGSNKPRPKAEVYIPIPQSYWKKYPNWFDNEFDFLNYKNNKNDENENKEKNEEKDKNIFKFYLHLPDGKVYKARITQENYKALQTSPQDALGKWLLYDVLGIKNDGTEIVTMETLKKAGYDSVKLWHEDPDDKNNVWIDFAPIGSFERYMNGEVTEDDVDYEDF